MNISDYLAIIFVVLIPILLLLINIQEKLEEINYRKYWNGIVNKTTMTLCSIWAVVGLIIAALGLWEFVKLCEGSDIYWIIILVVSTFTIYFGTELISLGIAKAIDKFSKEEE